MYKGSTSLTLRKKMATDAFNEIANYEYKIDHIGEAEHWINRM